MGRYITQEIIEGDKELWQRKRWTADGRRSIVQSNQRRIGPCMYELCTIRFIEGHSWLPVIRASKRGGAQLPRYRRPGTQTARSTPCRRPATDCTRSSRSPCHMFPLDEARFPSCLKSSLTASPAAHVVSAKIMSTRLLKNW